MNGIARNCEFTSEINAEFHFRDRDELQQLIESAAVISFDFFDTLFVRPLANPEDAFDLLGRQFSIPDFRERRRAAQVEAFRHMHAEGRKEITLDDIYACLAVTGLSSSELMRAEYALELSLLVPNPEIFELFLTLLATGKQVVITSDMYLPGDFFIEVLRPHGLAHVPLFISADFNATKRDTGELFEVVASKLGVSKEDILHIGDNQLADVKRAREMGFKAFHYRASREQHIAKNASLSTSIAQGMLRTSARHIPAKSYSELGFIYGGSANVGFLQWVVEQAKMDGIEHVLFVSRDGYALERIANSQCEKGQPKFNYFLGSRIAFTLAAINSGNFKQFIPFLLSGGDGLSPCELLERIGVSPPAPEVMHDLGLGQQIRVSGALHERLVSFLYAYRWEILKVCSRNRRALYRYLKQIGVAAGSRVALVDVGWSGTTQEAFEMALRPMMALQVYGYYFCLADTPERLCREQTHCMKAMINSETTSTQIISSIYANRVAVEFFFSAPHHSVIGLQQGKLGVEPVLDPGRGNTDGLLRIAKDITKGIEAFASHYRSLRSRIGFSSSPIQTAWPLIELVTEMNNDLPQLLSRVRNFDTWASSRNHNISIADYIKKDLL